jgi:hypothetical protein
MQIIRTVYFQEQIEKQLKNFPKIENDVSIFLNNIDHNQWQFLGAGLYKFRIKNSSIPTGKRDGYRIIVYINHQENILLPIILYSKSHTANLAKDELYKHFQKSLQSLSKN